MSAVEKAQLAHSLRFRKVSNGYPHHVAKAYGGDIAAAMADDDPTVAATVAAWEVANGLQVRDWHLLGQEEEGRDEGLTLPPLTDDQVQKVAALLSLPTIRRPVVGSRGGRS